MGLERDVPEDGCSDLDWVMFWASSSPQGCSEGCPFLQESGSRIPGHSVPAPGSLVLTARVDQPSRASRLPGSNSWGTGLTAPPSARSRTQQRGVRTGASSEHPQDRGVSELLEMPLCLSMGAGAATNCAHSPLGCIRWGNCFGGKDHPQAGEKSAHCAAGLWCCVAAINGGCKMLQPPTSHVPWSMSHGQQVRVPQPAAISPQYPRVYLYSEPHTFRLRPASRSNPARLQAVRAFYREVVLIHDIVFPVGLLKHRGARPRSQQEVTARETVLQGRM